MVYQITTDENNIIIQWSIGGYIPNGIDVDKIPEEVLNSPMGEWCYSEEKSFYKNPNYIPPDLLSLAKNDKIINSKKLLSEWFATHPYLFTDGKYYACTEEKQSLLNGNLASYERATKAGIDYQLKWNSTGEECVNWEYKNLLTLSLLIAAYVAPKVSKQQEIELQIKACTTVDEVNEIVINYDE